MLKFKVSSEVKREIDLFKEFMERSEYSPQTVASTAHICRGFCVCRHQLLVAVYEKELLNFWTFTATEVWQTSKIAVLRCICIIGW